MNQLDEVVKFALYQCRARNNPITETLASYVAQTILNKRTNKFYLEEKLNESELNELKNETLNKLSNQNAPDLKTIQLQIQYDSAYVEMELQRQEKIKKQSNETGKYIDDVVTLEIKNAKDFEGLTTLYTKMFHYLIYKNKELIEDPINFDAQAQFNMDKEVGAALESVIPRAALGPFVSLNPSEKVTQLVELANLVIGIRLFNKKIGKGGVSLSSLEDLTKYNARELSDQIKQIALETIEQCEIYTTFFINQDKFQMSNEDIEKYKDELAFLRQYLSYILSLQEDIEQSEAMIEQNRIRFIKEMEDLKKLLEHKSSAPKEQVYPKFALLAQSHIGLFEDKQISIERVELFRLLVDLRKMMKLSMPLAIQKQCKQMESTQPDNLALINYQPESGVQRLLPQNTPDFMQTQLDYFGFCIWSVVKKNGLLIPGKPSLGVFRYRDKNCVFSNEIAINEFLSEPQRYLTGVIDICRQKPHLIRLFRVEENFKNLNLKLTFESGSLLSNKLMVDKDVQTPVHFIEKNLDPNYCWNEWELRRKAIQMANIRKRQTKASQTILSNFKVDSEAQVYEMKDQSTSTGQNKGLNPLRPRNYIVGLRDKSYNQQ
ncbi:unnamed protein product [Paramecium primaurelia]|uniref:Cilia- and flagella-associated protein 206 n=1 Tax=Paramecium primaurelia TaxID=5886 RepID=A0A8S1NMA1_PARPR|nr:unnamed protein product [Paramecium primaurelia]